MKKFLAMSMVAVISLTAVGCGKDNSDTAIESTTVAVETQSEEITEEVSTDVEGSEEVSQSETTTKLDTSANHPQVTEIGAFGDSIKSMVLDKDMAGLSAIANYPVHVSAFGDIATAEDFAALNASDVLTADLVEAVTMINTAELAENDSAEVVMGTDSLNITFANVDGTLLITSINN